MKYILFFLFVFVLFNTACSSSGELATSECIAEVEELTVPENLNFISSTDMLDRISESNHTMEYQFPMVEGGMSALAENLHYPPSARERSDVQRVMLQALISEEGELLDLVLLQNAECDLVMAATYAVRESEFTPASLDSEAIATTINIPIVFRQ